MMQPPLYRIAVIAFEGISAFHLSVPCMVFQDAFVDQSPRFKLTICSATDSDLQSSSGFGIHIDQDINALKTADIVIVPSWPNDLPAPPKSLIDGLIAAHQRGAMLVGLCLGAFVIAHTGLLDGKAATTHWALCQRFSQQFPNINVDSQPLFIDQQQIITSAGIAASLDCCLHIVRKLCGSELASQLARVMVTAPYRSGGQQQYIPTPISSQRQISSSLAQVMERIEQQLAQPHSIDSVAALCAMSRRTFTRRFKAAYGCTFGYWLLNRRLIYSQQLLEQDKHSIALIADLAGFGSESIYRKHFKAAFALSPSQWRQQFTGLS
ncbi:helix-turn-helix domain-containing protein [Shewanella sp. Scap07]|uniref:GlxA family transcriptional regulator n=1 Tax=Shewanella sp. Scap07 TaxID=2589987 RepID=UPI0015B7BA01|nr:helix-turn-helix domain-containing protein [Shewanella sp. Scap07]QLE84832.1 helix-turn-helix domain-containing protein [Shewanella sp. Scap07]